MAEYIEKTPLISLTLRRAIARSAVLFCCSGGVLSACGLSNLSPFHMEDVDAGNDASAPSTTGPDALPAPTEDAEAPPDAIADAAEADAEDDASSVDNQDADAADDAGPTCGSCTTPPNSCFATEGTCNGAVCTYDQLPTGSTCKGDNQCASNGSCGSCTCGYVECYTGLCTSGSGSACVYVPAPKSTKCGFLFTKTCDGLGKCSN
jgi:hypothetical protein